MPVDYAEILMVVRRRHGEKRLADQSGNHRRLADRSSSGALTGLQLA